MPPEANTWAARFRQQTEERAALGRELARHERTKANLADRHSREKADLNARHVQEVMDLDEQARNLEAICRSYERPASGLEPRPSAVPSSPSQTLPASQRSDKRASLSGAKALLSQRPEHQTQSPDTTNVRAIFETLQKQYGNLYVVPGGTRYALCCSECGANTGKRDRALDPKTLCQHFRRAHPEAAKLASMDEILGRCLGPPMSDEDVKRIFRKQKSSIDVRIRVNRGQVKRVSQSRHESTILPQESVNDSHEFDSSRAGRRHSMQEDLVPDLQEPQSKRRHTTHSRTTRDYETESDTYDSDVLNDSVTDVPHGRALYDFGENQEVKE